MALTKVSYSMLLGAPINVLDFGAVQVSSIDEAPTVSNDSTAAIQAAIDSVNTGCVVYIPAGIYIITDTIYLRRDGVHIVGAGKEATNIRFICASPNIAFSGDTAKTNSLNTYSGCSLREFTVLRSYSNVVTAAANDASIVVDITSFSYGYFDINCQTMRSGGRCIYGQGNAGTSPYYNKIESRGLFGGGGNQKAIQFAGGAWTGGSNGPNANMIGPITRIAAVETAIAIESGQGNMFTDIGAESISGAYIVLGNNLSVDTGTSSGSNNSSVLNDTTKTWTTNAFVNGAVQITSGTGAGQVRKIATNNATQLQLAQPWATVPDNTSAYTIFLIKAQANKFTNIRQEGSLSSNFIFAWPDSADTEVDHTSIQSVGGYLEDRSCRPTNKFYGQSRTVLHHEFIAPGAGADINAFIKNGVFGGVKFAGPYVVDWVFAETTATSHGDKADIVVDCGGTTVGTGNPSLALSIPDGSSQGCAMVFGQRPNKEGEQTGIFLNLKTGASFSAGVSVTVSIGVTLVGI